MATERHLNLLLDCIICGKGRAKRNPRTLACKHGFCEKCLLGTKTIHLEGQIQCPVCWQKTPLTQNGICDLPQDSTVLAADRATQISRKAQLCDLCLYKGDENVACAHCKDCEFKLCPDCVGVHRKKEKLAGHVILEEICKTHFRDFTHACLTCYSGLCYGCIMSEFHDDHNVCEIVDAKDKASGLMAVRKVLLREEIQGIDKMINFTIDESVKRLNERRKQTEEKLNVYKTKVLESIMAALDKRDQEFHKSVSLSLEKQNEACSKASNCLNEMRMDKDDGSGKLNILSLLSKTSVDMFSAVDDVRTSLGLSVKTPEISDDFCESTESTNKSVFEFKVQLGSACQYLNESKPKKELSINMLPSEDKGFSKMWSAYALPNGSALLADSDTNYASTVNVKGEEVCRYRSANDQRVRGLTLHCNDVYIGSYNGNIISVVSGGQPHAIHLDPGVGHISELMIEEDHIILVDQQKSLQKYSLDGKLIQELVTGNFYSFTAAEFPGIGKVYIVPDLSANQVHMYRPDGSLIRTFGKHGTNDGEFGIIRDSAILPNGNIAVADEQLHRISEFTFDGTFVRHLLTEEDGLKRPTGISISYPYIWVGCWNEAMMFKWN